MYSTSSSSNGHVVPIRWPSKVLIAAMMQRIGSYHAASQGSCLVKADNTEISSSFELAGIEHVDSFQPELLGACPQRTDDDC